MVSRHSATLSRFVGSSVRRVEDHKVLRGKTIYVGDISIPGMVYLSMVRSTYSHARLIQVDVSEALRQRGAVAAVTGKEIAKDVKPIPVLASPQGLKAVKIYPLAVSKVRYSGEGVAAVVTSNRYSMEDVAELVRVEYEPLAPIVDSERALESNSTLIFDEWSSNEAYRLKVGNDTANAFAEADYILRERFRIQRQSGAPLEPRGVVANYDDSTDNLTVWSSTQWPHVVRTVLSQCLGVSENKIRVIAPDVGGGFGSKQDVYPEEILTAYLSMKLKKPVKWIANRREDMTATVHAREQVHYLEVAAKKDGEILAVKDRIIADLGAFHTMSVGPELVTVFSLPGPYKIKNWSIELQCVVTNKTPVGAYRGFGQTEATFVIERAVNILSRELGLDPALVRLKNFIQPNEFPYTSPLASSDGYGTYDSGDYPACLEKVLSMINYGKFRAEQQKATKQGRRIGVGFSSYVEVTGLGPSKGLAASGFKYSGFDSVSIRLDPSGKVTVSTGLSPHGQGLETTLAQVCADELGVKLEDITVLHGDTQNAPYGYGTWGSRSAVIGSTALVLSARKVKEKAKKLAAYALEAREEDIKFSRGKFFVRGSSSQSIRISGLAHIAHKAHAIPDGVEPGLEATTFYDPPGLTYSNGAHAAIVEVDTESGCIRILKYAVVHDCGRIINPAIVEGQVHGGVAQGIAGALFEDLIYDDNGQLLTSTFMDYLIPSSIEVPEISVGHLETPTPLNPLGVKGMGEGGAIAPAAAITNAIDDALAFFDVRIISTPITADKIHSLLKNSETTLRS